jgi:hypothetical protein
VDIVIDSVLLAAVVCGPFFVLPMLWRRTRRARSRA